MLRNVDQDVVALHLHGKRCDSHGRIAIVRARAAVELPGVPGAGETDAVQCPLSERSAAMWARSRERVNAAIDIANRVFTKGMT